MDPGIPVPPEYYGGIERIVYLLAETYQQMGHKVTLLAGPGSYCSGHTITFGINKHNRSKYQRIKELLLVWACLSKNHKQFDLIHNFGRLAYLLPVLNKPLTKIMSYQRQVSKRGIKLTTALPNKKLLFTGCSNYCASTGNVAGNWKTVYNAINFSAYQLNQDIEKDAPLMFLGRLDKIKGAHTAIRVAKTTHHKLILAGNIPHTADGQEYFKKEIEPLIDGDQIKYDGELNDTQKNIYLSRAKALLFPIEWDEPFGIVMIEAMACGTPVIGFRRGAVPEVVEPGKTGFIVQDEAQMTAAINNIPAISRKACRDEACMRFDIKVIAVDYLSLVG